MAGDPGGGQDRALRLRGAGPVLGRRERPDAADRQRGAVLGRRRHRHGDHGHLARGRRDLRPGHGRADRRVDPAVLRHAGGPGRRRVLRLRARRGLGRLVAAHARGLRRGQGRVGPQRAEGVGHQRRHRRRARRRRLGRQGARLARPGRVRRPARHRGPDDGHQGLQARPARLAHRRRLPRRLPRPRLLPARRQGEARRAARQGARGQVGQGPGREADLRALPADGRRYGGRHRPGGLRSARRRSASRAQRTSTRSSTPATASSSASRSSTTRRSRSRWPT